MRRFSLGGPSSVAHSSSERMIAQKARRHEAAHPDARRAAFACGDHIEQHFNIGQSTIS
jgi:hypothetical protein